MKVLDLRCTNAHRFEGWFANEDDFQRQLSAGQVQCPVCADAKIQKLLSAPRIQRAAVSGKGEHAAAAATDPEHPQTQELLTRMRQWVASSEDVGNRFASEARAMHEGEMQARAIRGVASAEEARALLEDGIPVLPVPPVLAEPLH